LSLSKNVSKIYQLLADIVVTPDIIAISEIHLTITAISFCFGDARTSINKFNQALLALKT